MFPSFVIVFYREHKNQYTSRYFEKFVFALQLRICTDSAQYTSIKELIALYFMENEYTKKLILSLCGEVAGTREYITYGTVIAKYCDLSF